MPPNAKSVNTDINIRPVPILKQLLVRWLLAQAETMDTIMIIVFTKIYTM